MAYSGDTGCGAAHLHFATKQDGVPFDPYAGSTHWVGGVPIPMGYRDQDGYAQGPFALDNVKIRDKWLQLQGTPGAPIEGVWTDLCDAGGQEAPTTEYIQRFEKGYIHYCGSASAEYVTNGYNNVVYDLKARYSCVPGENSKIVIENTSDFPAIISVTLLDNANHVRDSRVYKPLNPWNSWEFIVRDVYYDWLVQEPPWVFEGYAFISADMNVDVYHSYDDSTDCQQYLPKISK